MEWYSNYKALAAIDFFLKVKFSKKKILETFPDVKK